MPEYHPLIARAVEGLGNNTPDTRRMLYERARAALLAQLRGIDPPPSETEITRERLALEDAIREVEAESVRKAQAEPRPGLVAPYAIDALSGAASATTMATAAWRERQGGAPGSAPLRGKEKVSQTAAPSRDAHNDYRGAHPHQFSDGHETTWDHARPADHEQSPDMLEDGSAPMYGLDQSYDVNDEQRIERGLPPVRRFDYRGQRALRSYRGGSALLIAAVLIVAAVGSLVYWQWSNINGLYQFLSDMRSRQSQTVQQSAGAPQSTERVPQEQARPQPPAAGSKVQSGPATAQRVVLYEEDPGNPQGTKYIGAATWRTETVSSGSGLAPELQIRADVAIPERNMMVTWSLRRNTDQALPASHTIEIMFNLPKDFSGGGVANVAGVLMKESEQPRGIPLAGLTVKVTNSFFMIGLSAVDADVQQNMQLLKERPWFGIPLVYDNGGRAVLKFEKGQPGAHAFSDAFAAWGN